MKGKSDDNDAHEMKGKSDDNDDANITVE